MPDELAARQRAIGLRLAGRSVKYICAALGRVEAWFYKWWCRYLEDGPDGLYDLTRANHHVAQRISPELERTILSVRRRRLASYPLQPDRGHRRPERTENPGHPTASQRTYH
jgi:hypothetical protein